ncbi:unnamed protein product, partial [Strongylus vulgaris]
GSGYVDHGADIFDDEEEEEDVGDRKSKKKKKDKKEGSQKKGLDNYFAPAMIRGKVKDDAEVKLDDDEDLKDILAGLNDEALDMDVMAEPELAPCSSSARNPFKREGEYFLQIIVQLREYDNDDFGAPDVDDYHEPPPSLASCTPALKKNAKETIGNAESEERELKTEMEEMEVEAVHKKVDEKQPVQTMLLAAEWDDNKETCSEPAVEVTAGSEAFYVKEDGQQMIRMYWLDAFEDPVKHSGTVYLFGRVNVSGSKWASCCVTIKNIFRQVFFLPRETVSQATKF